MDHHGAHFGRSQHVVVWHGSSGEHGCFPAETLHGRIRQRQGRAALTRTGLSLHTLLFSCSSSFACKFSHNHTSAFSSQTQTTPTIYPPFPSQDIHANISMQEQHQQHRPTPTRLLSWHFFFNMPRSVFLSSQHNSFSFPHMCTPDPIQSNQSRRAVFCSLFKCLLLARSLTDLRQWPIDDVVWGELQMQSCRSEGGVWTSNSCRKSP